MKRWRPLPEKAHVRHGIATDHRHNRWRVYAGPRRAILGRRSIRPLAATADDTSLSLRSPSPGRVADPKSRPRRGLEPSSFGQRSTSTSDAEGQNLAGASPGLPEHWHNHGRPIKSMPWIKSFASLVLADHAHCAGDNKNDLTCTTSPRRRGKRLLPTADTLQTGGAWCSAQPSLGLGCREPRVPACGTAA
jgi:hypothetical protein